MRARFSAPVHIGPGGHPASCTMRSGSIPGGKERAGRYADPSPLLAPWSRKSRAVPLLPLWAVRPVQSLSACTRVHFTHFYLLGLENKKQSCHIYMRESHKHNAKIKKFNPKMHERSTKKNSEENSYINCLDTSNEVWIQ